MTESTVVVVGGGVAGLSAAHLLVERGFTVAVYEHHDVPGGKARSLGVANTAQDGRHDLPAEHGFRFFPAYYRHVIDTMSQIPYWDSGSTVVDQLVAVDNISLNSFVHPPVIMPAKMPRTFGELFKLVRDMRKQPRPKFERGEIRYYLMRLWQILSSCEERRNDEYEQTAWWDFIDAEHRSPNYRRYLANISRTLVAANPRKVSTRTNGNVWIQTLLGIWSPHADRILKGPTNEMWVYPWLKYLLDKGVTYYVNASATEFLTAGGTVRGVRICQSEKPREWANPSRMARVLDCDRYGITKFEDVSSAEQIVTGDYYVSAVPVERMAQILRGETMSSDKPSELLSIDPNLRTIDQLRYSVQWMNGIQFYLRPIPGQSQAPNMPGHSINADSPLALTSIFQTQYWQGIDMSKYGDGTVRNILSVDISDWLENHGRIYDKPAFELTRTEVKNEVWEDLKSSLRHWPEASLEDDNLVDWYLDFDIDKDIEHHLLNKEPLLVNRVNTWRLRPQAKTGVGNLVLASDYVQTYTDLATMEGANEAARHAVNAILDQSGSQAQRCEIWKLEEPEILRPFRDYDRRRYEKGKPWSTAFPLLMKLRLIWIIFKTLLGVGR